MDPKGWAYGYRSLRIHAIAHRGMRNQVALMFPFENETQDMSTAREWGEIAKSNAAFIAFTRDAAPRLARAIKAALQVVEAARKSTTCFDHAGNCCSS